MCNQLKEQKRCGKPDFHHSSEKHKTRVGYFVCKIQRENRGQHSLAPVEPVTRAVVAGFRILRKSTLVCYSSSGPRTSQRPLCPRTTHLDADMPTRRLVNGAGVLEGADQSLQGPKIWSQGQQKREVCGGTYPVQTRTCCYVGISKDTPNIRTQK